MSAEPASLRGPGPGRTASCSAAHAGQVAMTAVSAVCAAVSAAVMAALMPALVLNTATKHGAARKLVAVELALGWEQTLRHDGLWRSLDC